MIGLLLAWQVAAAMPLLEQNRFADARPLLEKACMANEVNGCYLLGRTLFTLDRYDDALKTLAPLITTDPNPWRVHDAIAGAYEALRRPAEAEKEYRQAVDGNKDRTPEPRYHLGRFLIREGRPADAVATLTPAAAKFSRHQLIRFELGRAYYQMNRITDAEAQLTAAPSLDEARRLLQKIKRQKGS
ncbi:MAG: tetratricopeptide repeat protein [Acidobacteria bacterium]|nr:tetratricopeptide repeat protein [Acidobacteriota bacterium]